MVLIGRIHSRDSVVINCFRSVHFLLWRATLISPDSTLCIQLPYVYTCYIRAYTDKLYIQLSFPSAVPLFGSSAHQTDPVTQRSPFDFAFLFYLSINIFLFFLFFTVAISNKRAYWLYPLDSIASNVRTRPIECAFLLLCQEWRWRLKPKNVFVFALLLFLLLNLTQIQQSIILIDVQLDLSH